MDPNLVSIIVPTYNRLAQLKECMRSIAAQDTTYPYEVIVVNDAGQSAFDTVMSVAKELRGVAQYYEHVENRGLAATRNTGISHAHGKIFCYLDDDDIFYPNHIQTVVSALQNPKYGVVYTDALKATGNFDGENFVAQERKLEYSNEPDFNSILIQNRVPVLCYAHRQECLAKVGVFDESFKVFEDWDLFGIRMGAIYKCLHIKGPTAEYRWHLNGSNMSSNNRGDEFWKGYFAKMYIKHIKLGSDGSIAWRKSWLKHQGYALELPETSLKQRGRRKR